MRKVLIVLSLLRDDVEEVNLVALQNPANMLHTPDLKTTVPEVLLYTMQADALGETMRNLMTYESSCIPD